MARDMSLAYWRKQLWDAPEDDTLRLALSDWLQDHDRPEAAALCRANVAWRVMIRDQDWSRVKPQGDVRILPPADLNDWDRWSIAAAAVRKAAGVLASDPFAGVEDDGSWRSDIRFAWPNLHARLHQAEVFACGLGAREVAPAGGGQEYRFVLRRATSGRGGPRDGPFLRVADLCLDAYEALVLCPKKPLDPRLNMLLSCAWSAWTEWTEFTRSEAGPTDPAA